ncbi:hypothetical protein V5P93_006938 [Actinokineospora auranticolor]|uniref:DUF4064 domain-containing protein n=1 Tax=Actinokineospora auranticolor TaxID=155976 RepID=A0A2S6GW66_9PSEU|nr:hypothetical protein [Actinokineospora auranticolor]PPK69420.1 hypothetical protein CLV40_10326 [Actinokineospora auranticolor]
MATNDPGPQDAPRYEPMPGVPEQERQTAPRPRAVNTSSVLWFVNAALYLLGTVLTLTMDHTSLREAARKSLEAAKEPVTPEKINQLVDFTLVISGVIAALIIGLTVLFVLKVRSGKQWGRTALTVLGGLLILYSLYSVSGGGANVIIGILPVLLVGGGIYLLYTPDAKAFLEAGRRR